MNCIAGLHANDITISSPTLTATNTVAGTTQVQFNISWANSWRTSSAPNNWDAAWVFVKYRDANTGLWQHARLGDSHLAPVDAFVATGLLDPSLPFNAATNWGVGAFVYRAVDGTGTFTGNGTQLQWNYGQNGITYADIAEVKVFAIEMVLVPQGPFYVGSGGTEAARFKDGTTNNPFQIASEAALSMGNVDGQLWAHTTIATATLPAAFPKGFAAFYMMKYLITQQQYVDFLNTLTRTQQNTRTHTDVSGISVTDRYVMIGLSIALGRNGIRCDASLPPPPTHISFYCDLNGNGTGGEADDGQWVACNWLSWLDVAAYLDWSGLRPMTELEYEKACRGPLTPVANEYAWGSTSITGAANITNGGAINESCDTDGANAVYNNHAAVQGPMRVGVLATGSTTRAQSGAGYYGAMDLTGNLYDRTVKVENVVGRLFEGTFGDGAVDATGDADAATWPNSGGTGTGGRGGSWRFGATFLPVSRRDHVVIGNFNVDTGGRGCRSVP